MATLYGRSLDIFYGVDHTYVTSSDGQIWSCWGRSTDGQIICSGEAESAQADCLSQKNSHAGLLYGLTGVCHQTANRILFPARCIVSKAQSYWLSTFVYGTYGLSVLKFNSRLVKCLGAEDYLSSRHDYNNPDLNNELIYLQQIKLLYAQALTKRRQGDISKERMVLHLLRNELKLTSTYRLGSEAGAKVSSALLKYQSELLVEKNYYDRALMAKRLKPEAYATKVNGLITSAFKDIQRSLGASHYQKMFGIQPEIQLLDPQIMYNVYNKGKS